MRAVSRFSTRAAAEIATAAAAGMIPMRPCTRASAASTSSMRCRKARSSNTARIASLPYSVPNTGLSAKFTGMALPPGLSPAGVPQPQAARKTLAFAATISGVSPGL